MGEAVTKYLAGGIAPSTWANVIQDGCDGGEDAVRIDCLSAGRNRNTDRNPDVL